MPQYYELLSQNLVTVVTPQTVTKAANIPGPSVGGGLLWRGTTSADRMKATINSTYSNLPDEVQAGDTIIGICTQDDVSHLAPNLPTYLNDYTVVRAMSWPQTFHTGLAVWSATYNNESTITGHGAAGGSNWTTAIYAVNGTVSAVTAGTSSQHTATPAWNAVSMNDGDLAIAVTSVYDPADAYIHADTVDWNEDYNDANWVGLTCLSQEVTTTGSITVDPVGSYTGSGHMTTLIIRVAV